MAKDKRLSGQIIADKKRTGHKIWLVLSESTGKEGAKVTHPIHDGPFPLSGYGRVHTETVPFCPKCETTPNTSGAPIDHDPVEQKEIAILQRIANTR